MNNHDEESGHSLHHFRSTSVPSLTTTPPPPLEDVEPAGTERSSSNRDGSSWGGNDLWFGSEGAGKTGFKRPSLRVLLHSTPLPSHPTFSSSPTHLLPPILILTPASPPPDRNIPHSVSSPSLTTLSFTGTNVSKRASTLPSSPSSSASSSSFYDQQQQQQTALLTPAPYSPTSSSARRFKTSQHKSKKDSIDLELLPLHDGGDFHGRAYRGRGERAIERLSRVMALLMLMLAGIIVLRVLGDVWLAKMQKHGSWSGEGFEEGAVVEGGGGESRGSMVTF